MGVQSSASSRVLEAMEWHQDEREAAHLPPLGGFPDEWTENAAMRGAIRQGDKAWCVLAPFFVTRSTHSPAVAGPGSSGRSGRCVQR